MQRRLCFAGLGKTKSSTYNLLEGHSQTLHGCICKVITCKSMDYTTIQRNTINSLSSEVLLPVSIRPRTMSAWMYIDTWCNMHFIETQTVRNSHKRRSCVHHTVLPPQVEYPCLQVVMRKRACCGITAGVQMLCFHCKPHIWGHPWHLYWPINRNNLSAFCVTVNNNTQSGFMLLLALLQYTPCRLRPAVQAQFFLLFIWPWM